MTFNEYLDAVYAVLLTCIAISVLLGTGWLVFFLLTGR